MPKKRPVEEEEEEEFEEVEDVEEETKVLGGRGPQPPRMSVTLPPNVRKQIRLAAAIADMEINEWCRVVLATAASKSVAKHFPDQV